VGYEPAAGPSLLGRLSAAAGTACRANTNGRHLMKPSRPREARSAVPLFLTERSSQRGVSHVQERGSPVGERGALNESADAACVRIAARPALRRAGRSPFFRVARE